MHFYAYKFNDERLEDKQLPQRCDLDHNSLILDKGGWIPCKQVKPRIFTKLKHIIS